MRGAEPPLVLAYRLDEAREALARAGWSCAGVDLTAAPGEGTAVAAPEEELLVVRQRPAGDGAVLLTVARHPGGPAGA